MVIEMVIPPDPEFLSQERAAYITWLIAHGAILSTSEVAEMLSMSFQGAWYLMGKIARVIPIFRGDDGKWQVCK